MNNPLISIIIPIYNLNNNLNQCLDSLIHQTEKNIEIIIIDDCSQDDIRLWISNNYNDNRIIYHRLNENTRPGGARNAGVSLAKGKYIGFCDSDDWVDIQYFEKACYALEKEHAQIAVCGRIREEGDINITKPKYHYDSENIISGKTAFQVLSINYKMGFEISPMCTDKVFLLSFIKKNKLRFQENVYYQDVLFLVNAFLEDCLVITVPDSFYHYFKREDSIIQSFSQKHISDYINLCSSLKMLLQERHLLEKYKINYFNIIIAYFSVLLKGLDSFVFSEIQQKNYLRDIVSSLFAVINIEDLVMTYPFPQIRDTLNKCFGDSIVE